MRKVLDIRNKRFGSLLAIEPTDKRASNGSIIWHFYCDCGNTEVYKSGTDVKSGSYTRCEKCCKQNAFGNKRYIAPLNSLFNIGDKRNHLMVIDIDFSNYTYKTVKYLCSCDCGSDKKYGYFIIILRIIL